jgi:hypothetical protein
LTKNFATVNGNVTWEWQRQHPVSLIILHLTNVDQGLLNLAIRLTNPLPSGRTSSQLEILFNQQSTFFPVSVYFLCSAGLSQLISDKLCGPVAFQ